MTYEAELHNRVIQALGGKAKLARALGLEPHRLSKWHVRGIPFRYLPHVIEMAAALEPPLTVTVRDLEMTKPASREAA